MNDLVKPTFGSSPFALLVFAVSIMAFGWQVHSMWVGLGLGVLFLLLVPLLNAFGLVRFGSLKLGTLLRIGLFILLMVGIALSGAETCDANGICEPLL